MIVDDGYVDRIEQALNEAACEVEQIESMNCLHCGLINPVGKGDVLADLLDITEDIRRARLLRGAPGL